MLLGPVLEPTGLMPRTTELLGFLAATILNAGIFAAFIKMKWRPRLAFTFRTWLSIAGLANATALAFMCLWFPRAGWQGLFDRPHVQRVVASALLTVLTLVVVAVSLLLRGGFQPSAWIVVALQFLRLLPAGQAMETWPGGDDGPGMGWAGIVIPFTGLLALVGAATCVWCALRAARRPHCLPSERE